MKNLYLTDDGFVVKNGAAVGFYGDIRGHVLSFPKGITAVDKGAVKIDSSVDTVVIPEGVEEIGEECFAGCSSLVEIRLPSTLKEIRARAFENCTKLEKVALPKGLESIGECVFSSTAIKEVSLPNNLAPNYGIFKLSQVERVNLSSVYLEKLYDSNYAMFVLSPLRELIIDGETYDADAYFMKYYKKHKDMVSIKAFWGTPFIERISMLCNIEFGDCRLIEAQK